jgi:hypothetical protein
MAAATGPTPRISVTLVLEAHRGGDSHLGVTDLRVDAAKVADERIGQLVGSRSHRSLGVDAGPGAVLLPTPSSLEIPPPGTRLHGVPCSRQHQLGSGPAQVPMAFRAQGTSDGR